MPNTSLRARLIWTALVSACLLVLFALPALGQLTPSDDSYIDTTKPTVANGTKTTLGVISPSQTTYVRFDLSSIPTGYTSANIAKASLKVYVNAVTTTGSFNVDFVNGTWAESSLTANNAPALGSTIAASVPLTKAQAHDYVVIDVTAALQAWLDGTEANDGLALVANSPFSATFDSKESTTQSHPSELDIVFAGSGGSGITGINTASGSGLTGGGTSGTLNLSLATNCGIGQVLQWSGGGWACASLSGGGTITGVTAGTDLTGGGSSGTVTLNLDTTKIPQLAVANTFTGNQTVNGNLSATGLVSGSGYQIGSDLFAFGSSANSNAFLGFSGNLTSTGTQNAVVGFGALVGNTTGGSNAAFGSHALPNNTTGNSNSATGASALFLNTTGSNNSASGTLALGFNSTGSNNTALGYAAGPDKNHQNLTNATAIGANAEVTASNALVLGSINGVNGATADTMVGIGITSPTYKLHVGNAVNTFRVEGPATPGTGGSAASFGGYGDFGIDAPGCTQCRFLVQENGKVGIGSGAPSRILTVGMGWGHAIADGWDTYSSRRWKTNIQTLPNALAKVEQLRGVTYQLKESGKHEIGVIAEEVGQVVPEVVSYEENGKDAQGVDYSRLTALLIEAVKQQQREIREQRAQIQSELRQVKAQQRQIMRLNDKLGVLEAAAQGTHVPAESRSSDLSTTDHAKGGGSELSVRASRK